LGEKALDGGERLASNTGHKEPTGWGAGWVPEQVWT
jgi:hypothetical protein